MQLPNQEISSTTSSNSSLVETPVLYTPPKTSTQSVPPMPAMSAMSAPPSKINNTLSDMSSSLQNFTSTVQDNYSDIYNGSPDTAKQTQIKMSIRNAYILTLIICTYITYNAICVIKPDFLVNEKKEILKLRTLIFANFVNSIVFILIVRYNPELVKKYLQMINVIE
jgi:hypothetical protein